jgi:hypothetical protein
VKPSGREYFVLFLFTFAVLGIEPGALHTLGKRCTTWAILPALLFVFCFWDRVYLPLLGLGSPGTLAPSLSVCNPGYMLMQEAERPQAVGLKRCRKCRLKRSKNLWRFSWLPEAEWSLRIHGEKKKWKEGRFGFRHFFSPFFCVGFVWQRVLQTVCPGWLWIMIFLISASWVVRITGVNHQCLVASDIVKVGNEAMG